MWKPSFDVARSLLFDYAHLASVRTRTCVDSSGGPIPWYTYPAIEYLKQLDFRDRTVFEFGSGSSTLFWAALARRVVSVEDDAEWYRQMAPRVPGNCQLILETDLGEYARAIMRTGERYDVIVVDGAARGKTRIKCSRTALDHLRDGGMIILDNSDWLPESARLLREAGLIQVDMTGFVPISSATGTTSFFLHRAFAFSPRGPRQPMPGPGAREQVWEHPDSMEPPVVHLLGESFGAVRRDERFSIASPAGPREFRFIVSEPSHGIRAAVLIDASDERAVLSLTERMTAPPAVEAILEQATRMTWPEFVAFINGHEKRRYDLPG
jgi:hypothetical protein